MPTKRKTRFHSRSLPLFIVAVGIMTDYGDNGAPRRALYGDITFRSLPQSAK